MQTSFRSSAIRMCVSAVFFVLALFVFREMADSVDNAFWPGDRVEIYPKNFTLANVHMMRAVYKGALVFAFRPQRVLETDPYDRAVNWWSIIELSLCLAAFLFYALGARRVVRKHLVAVAVSSLLGLQFLSFVSLQVISQLGVAAGQAAGKPLSFTPILESLPKMERMALKPLFVILRHAGGVGFIFLYGAIPAFVAVYGLMSLMHYSFPVLLGKPKEIQQHSAKDDSVPLSMIVALVTQILWWYTMVITTNCCPPGLPGVFVDMATWPVFISPIYWSLFFGPIGVVMLVLSTKVLAVGIRCTILQSGIWGTASRFCAIAYASSLWFLLCPLLQSVTWLYWKSVNLSGPRPITAHLPFAGPAWVGFLDGGYAIAYSFTFGSLLAGAITWGFPAAARLLRNRNARVSL